MKSSLATVELTHMVRELRSFIGSRVNKVFQANKKELVIELHHPKHKNANLTMLLPGYIFLAEEKGEMPDKPTEFALKMRKFCSGTILRDVEQLGMERIVKLTLGKQADDIQVIIELFSHGNVIFCDSAGIVLAANEYGAWKDRKIAMKHPYEAPKNIISQMDEKAITLICASTEKTLVKTLAMDCNLGGVYAEELCLRLGISKDADPRKLNTQEIKRIHSEIQSLLTLPAEPVAVLDGETLIDITPFPLQQHASYSSISYSSYSDALSSNRDKLLAQPKQKESKSRRILEEQEKHIPALIVEEEENKRIGDLIYTEYAMLKDLLVAVNELRKKGGWQAVRQKYKNHEVVKSFDEKNATIEVELG